VLLMVPGGGLHAGGFVSHAMPNTSALDGFRGFWEDGPLRGGRWWGVGTTLASGECQAAAIAAAWA
jgi:hypothetical protein